MDWEMSSVVLVENGVFLIGLVNPRDEIQQLDLMY